MVKATILECVKRHQFLTEIRKKGKYKKGNEVGTEMFVDGICLGRSHPFEVCGIGTVRFLYEQTWRNPKQWGVEQVMDSFPYINKDTWEVQLEEAYSFYFPDNKLKRKRKRKVETAKAVQKTIYK